MFPVLADSVSLDEDEGEAFEFDDSDNDIPQADSTPLAPPALPAPSSKDQSQDNMVTGHLEGPLPSPDPPAPSTTCDAALSPADAALTISRSSAAVGAAAEGEGTSAAEWIGDNRTDFPPPPPPPFDANAETDPRQTGSLPKW